MPLIFLLGSVSLIAVLFTLWIKAVRGRLQLERYSITPEALHALLAEKRDVLLYDVREPLDVLTASEIIPGSRRVAPKEIQENDDLIPKDRAIVAYCTCASDRASLEISRRALARNFFNVKFLKGGLAAWKEKGYPVEPYRESFHLDTAT
jgi:rhodanese-related sulfurtransferase